MNSNKLLIISVLLVFITASFSSCGSSSSSTDDAAAQEHFEEQEGEVDVLGFNPDSLRCEDGKVKSGQFFSTLLGSLGMTAQEAYNLTQVCDTLFDVRTLRVGNTYKAYFSAENTLEYLVYDRDRMHQVVFDCTEPYDLWIYEKPVVHNERYADVTINSSLWNDMLAADVSPLLILGLSDIYAWTVDFFGLQKGDRFRVLYQETVCDGDVIAVDTVRYAVFSHAGQDFPAIMFDQQDGGNLWWNEKGESMRKAFLKAPLKFSRISSGFSYARKHPVTRKVQPHTGVDYAAPKGTPVMTIGDGVITSMKYEGAGGNTIRIRHNSVYSTAYLHLSGYAKGLKVGQRVRQGDVIGYVGSTGRSTGPHLDFRVWKNGSPINPLKMDSPPAEPLKQENMEAFTQAWQSYQHQVDMIQAQSHLQTLFELL
jgi:murein DD-endopeptidase MepM/ murein hydrolase activator NlpD